MIAVGRDQPMVSEVESNSGPLDLLTKGARRISSVFGWRMDNARI